MQQVVIEDPYEFIPPSYSNLWPTLIQLYLKRYLQKTYGIDSIECRNIERLQQSIDEGHGILIAPNHCRLSDPLVVGFLSRQIKRHFHAMASWHVFKANRLSHFMLRRIGGFSIYREGIDKQALSTAIDILVAAKRPLIVFPEGAISRHNDQLMPLMDGTAFVARQAAKRRKKRGDRSGVMVHPVAIRYFFRGDMEQTVSKTLETIESHFSWHSQQDKSIIQRLRQIGQALLSLKEIEYFGIARAGDFYERVDALIEDLLAKLEDKWGIQERGEGVVARVKELRTAILPDMIHNKISVSERHQRRKELAACYYVQQMSHYPRDYVRASEKNIPEHIIETVERFEEDFTDRKPLHGPWHAVVEIGEAVEVSGQRDRSAQTDPIMDAIHMQLSEMLSRLSTESPRI